MDLSEIMEYLIDNLDITIEHNQEFGPVETIRVSLELGGNEIASSSCELDIQRGN